MEQPEQSGMFPSLRRDAASTKEKCTFRPLMFVMLMYRRPCEFRNHRVMDKTVELINRQNKNAIYRRTRTNTQWTEILFIWEKEEHFCAG